MHSIINPLNSAFLPWYINPEWFPIMDFEREMRAPTLKIMPELVEEEMESFGEFCYQESIRRMKSASTDVHFYISALSKSIELSSRQATIHRASLFNTIDYSIKSISIDQHFETDSFESYSLFRMAELLQKEGIFEWPEMYRGEKKPRYTNYDYVIAIKLHDQCRSVCVCPQTLGMKGRRLLRILRPWLREPDWRFRLLNWRYRHPPKSSQAF